MAGIGTAAAPAPYVWPATWIGPSNPCNTIFTSRPGSPFTHSLPANGGYTPGNPFPPG